MLPVSYPLVLAALIAMDVQGIKSIRETNLEDTGSITTLVTLRLAGMLLVYMGICHEEAAVVAIAFMMLLSAKKRAS
jgi:hypothetical protein